MNSPTQPDDVRMRGFSHRTNVADAIAWLDRQIKTLPCEVVSLTEAAGRVLAGDVISQLDVPGFDRSMMDGFALRAADTLDASAYNPIELAVIGQSLPGQPFSGAVAARQAVRIMTGAPLPAGADAVLPAELAEAHAGRILAHAAVSPGKHVGRVGEDIKAGEIVLRRASAVAAARRGSLGFSGGCPGGGCPPPPRADCNHRERTPAGRLAAGTAPHLRFKRPDARGAGRT